MQRNAVNWREMQRNTKKCKEINKNDEKQDIRLRYGYSSFSLLMNILNFLSFSSCISFTFCLFTQLKKKIWQWNDERISDYDMDIYHLMFC